MAIGRWTVLSSRLLHQGGPNRLRLDTCRTPGGAEVSEYLVREVADLAVVFALTEAREVVLVRQYRHGFGEEVLELPQGLLEPGEEVAVGAARELREETGYEAPLLTPVGDLLASPAHQTNRAHVLVGEGARLLHPVDPDPGEEIEVERMPIGAIEAAIGRGAIRAAHSVAAIYLALAYLRAGR